MRPAVVLDPGLISEGDLGARTDLPQSSISSASLNIRGAHGAGDYGNGWPLVCGTVGERNVLGY